MQKLLRLCLWQVVLGIFTVSVFSISTLSLSESAFAQEVQTQERGIRMRGPKSTDVFPYDRYGPITQRDTLWKIALTVRPDSRLSVYQVMQALYQANPNSFVNGNFNHLVQGQYLKIPSFDRMMSVNKNAARQKSNQDDKDWQKKQPKKVAKKAITPQVPSVNKKDLDTVKVEINDQLQKIDDEQQKRLTNIQNDVLDSIDGLQAILKENEDLRQRLTSFNSQLGTMQKEVAKGKEIKLQMDDMIKLQQALLEKAQAREQELLLEKQQAALEKNNIFSSLWFVVLMSTLPAILILFVVALIFKRRKTETITAESKPNKKSKVKSENISKEPKANIDEIDELSLEDELSLDDELSLEGEISLDDELSLEGEISLDDDLSIDLLEEEDNSENDVVHLDEDDDDLLDGLDDLEDILLDDDDELEGGELGQDALDSLLMEDDALEEPLAIEEQEAKESEALVDDQLDQSDLDDLLGDLGDDELVVEDAELSSIEEVDLDDLLDSIALDEVPLVKEEPSEGDNAQTEITDPDDIDALLDSMAIDEAPLVKEEPSEGDNAQTEITDPDDIDALLDSMAIDEAPLVKEEPSEGDNAQTEITDPDDIDALLDSMALDEAPLVKEEPSEGDNAQTEITDPDDIDALLDSMAIDEAPLVKEEPSEGDNAQTEITDPDDIDALLDSMAIDEAPLVKEEPSEGDNAQTEITDPDDIDALLASMDVVGLESDNNSEKKAVDEENVKPEENQNKAKIDSLTEEYLAPLLATDFSDILVKTETDLIEADASQEDFANDDFDIGDDLAEGAFDEDTLAELLNDQSTEPAVELTPDFSDQNVLAGLLNDENNDISQVSEATEINDIQELDSLDFDELLANIEEESSVASQSVDFNENLGVVDDVSLADFDNLTSNNPLNDNNQTTENEQDFVSVDSLLSESQYEVSPNEPYDKANIDVGLNEFSEFTDGVNQVDVDIDENGMAAKLDLAKVYIEIGDQDNALVILEEVVKQGDTQQQVVAQELLDNL
ncbi:FimV/HubP family polar landmark protein [Candidatus Colwellia aromaticivorans]|uniref:FimV/HubP family polar landmark protein n=1 Tax=Candidatus Colwellia aromaticivorans TaxID=2267621 RepID=UPI000DF36D51|nr:FimV/HubP family polar landmark protein [Candidatus Colwellia aromaticivorans]